jgi:23S rRNA G2445 N2-methylase RlmL
VVVDMRRRAHAFLSFRVRLARPFYATDFGLLYVKICKLPWHAYYPLTNELEMLSPSNISVASRRSALYHTDAVSQAVGSFLQGIRGPWRRRDTTKTQLPTPSASAGKIHMLFDNNRCAVSLDCAGEEPLFKRGYRQFVGSSPLRESFAAGTYRARCMFLREIQNHKHTYT